MLRFLAVGMFLSTSLFGSYYRADKSFNEYVAFAQDKVKGSVFVSQNNILQNRECSGTILNPWTVLTAAHCVTNFADNVALPHSMSVGYNTIRTYPITKYKAKRISVNAAYTPTKTPRAGSGYDIALLHLETPIYLAPHLYGQLSSISPAVGDHVIGYGYGIVNKFDASDPRPDNKNLLAYKTIVSERYPYSPFYGTELELRYDLSQPYAGNGAPGDSGGGIIDKDGKIIGVATTVDVSQTIPKYMNIVDTTSPPIRTFLNNYNADWRHATWSGSGKISDLSNWESGVLPHNHIKDDKDVHYDITEIRESTEIIVDKNFHVDRFVLKNPNSSFTVEKDRIATLDHGLDIQSGKSRIDGTMRAQFLHVGQGVTHSSPPGVILTGEGTISLNDGKVETPHFLMQGGYLEGNGTIFMETPGTVFQHKNGVISPSNGGNPGTIRINGPYQASKDSEINIRLFNDGTNDSLFLTSMLPSSLTINFIFPENLVKYNQKYTVLTYNGTISELYSSSYTDIDEIKKEVGWYGGLMNNGVITVKPTSSKPKQKTVSDNRPSVHNALNVVFTQGKTALSSFFERIQSMPSTVFSTALHAFSDPRLHKNLQKTLSNNFLQTLHKDERVELFLEKKRRSLDLKSFSFIGKNGFSGEDVLMSEKENTPLSFFISGDLYDNTSNYLTEGLTFGGDYAEGSALTGFSVHFKNTDTFSKLYNQKTLPSEYHFDLYYAKRGALFFYDHSFGHGFYAKDISYDNIWGKWDSHVVSNQTHLDSRLGIYNINERSFHLGYIGISGSLSKIDPFSTIIDQTLKVNTSESSLSSIITKIGLENKVKYHFGDIIYEPAIHTYISFPLFESFNSPSSSLEGAPEDLFHPEEFSLNKTDLFLNFALRIYVPHNLTLKIEIESSRQCEETRSKALFALNIKL